MDMPCELDIDLLCWGRGELGQTGCGRPVDIAPEKAHLREFTGSRLGTVKLLACGSSHSIVVTAPALFPSSPPHRPDRYCASTKVWEKANEHVSQSTLTELKAMEFEISQAAFEFVAVCQKRVCMRVRGDKRVLDVSRAPGIVLVLADNKGDKCNAYLKWSHNLCATCTCFMLQIKRLKALRRGKRQNRSPNQDHDAMSKKGLSRRCSCAVYIIEETLCTVIRKIMSSHVNDQTVCTVQMDNKILAWGNGNSGQLGDGEREVKDHPVEVKLPQKVKVGGGGLCVDDVDVVGVACGSRHSFLWTQSGHAYSFGNNFYAQLGYDFHRADFKEHQAFRMYCKISATFCGTEVNLLGTWIAIRSRGRRIRSKCQSSMGTVTFQVCQAGTAFVPESSIIPENISSGLRRATYSVCPGGRQCGGMWCTQLVRALTLSNPRNINLKKRNANIHKQNDYGQIGSGSNENAVVPRFVECVGHVSKVTCGANHNLALTGDGRLLQWGCGRACGNMKENILLPEEVTPPGSPVREIAGGCWHSMLLTDASDLSILCDSLKAFQKPIEGTGRCNDVQAGFCCHVSRLIALCYAAEGSKCKSSGTIFFSGAVISADDVSKEFMLPTVEELSENVKIEGKGTHDSESRARSTAAPGVFGVESRAPGPQTAWLNTQANVSLFKETQIQFIFVRDLKQTLPLWQNRRSVTCSGQLGLGEDRIHISTPCLLNYSQLAEVTQIQAGDSYSAAVTGSGEKNRESDHPEPGALCGDLVFIPRPTEHMEKENTVQDLERPQGSEEAGEDEESESAGNEENGEERPNNDEGDGALHDSAFAIARSVEDLTSIMIDIVWNVSIEEGA
ncbi:hypothetical protein F2P81_013804 [Scophthalmus maximus]|uniref:Uncharacterized protein n=1 Tax=Scophthalmus maximus TaxID=52904 RepID=A0A6A4SNJ9_SCOMX|nr:hypothetical protein F2P81_013804 [Scophthalmus maximus]